MSITQPLTCPHVQLILLAGALHPSGQDYACAACGQQFRAAPLVIGVSYGTPPGTPPGPSPTPPAAPPDPSAT